MLGFDYVGTVPALQSPHYQTVLPTLEDSSSSGTPYFTYLVVAHTTDLDYYYVSDVDSGYSVDNLVPIPPAGLIASVEPGPEVNLIWNSPTDPDVGHYNVYRSTTSGFTPGAGNKIGTSTSTSFTDTSPVEGVPSYYRIIAVDIHDNESTPSNEAEAAVTVNRQFSVQEKWNIVAVPLAMGDYTKTVLFPSAATNAFTFEDGYVAYGILENGRGYWMKFSSSELISHSGLERMEDIVTVAAGWNMVGSLSISIPVSTIGSIPGAIVTSSFYGYDAGYSSSETLEPGKGYWVKVSEAGQLVMTSSSTVPASNRIRIEDNGELPPPPPDVLNADVPDAYSLEQNYPNPFNPVSSISFVLPVAGQVTLTVFNMLGQEVAVLVNEVQGPGYKTVSFDASNLPSGVYTYRITAGTFTDVKKMLLIR
ncbi:MAG TPA: T9SS type A sorting domain-containing protein [Bacteroidota bacterium]|nr:T9SS type A sorting domain-containing protein [Bacteroidota bacterium]